MGTDLHYLLEVQSQDGTWFGIADNTALWDKDNPQPGMDKNGTVRLLMEQIRERNHDLFEILANCGGEGNPLAVFGLGTHNEGVFGSKTGWPNTLSQSGEAQDPERDGWGHNAVTRNDLQRLKSDILDKIQTLKNTDWDPVTDENAPILAVRNPMGGTDPVQNPQVQSRALQRLAQPLIDWIDCVERTFDLLTGTDGWPGAWGAVFATRCCDAVDSDLFHNNHARVQTLADLKTGGIPPERQRILFFFLS